MATVAELLGKDTAERLARLAAEAAEAAAVTPVQPVCPACGARRPAPAAVFSDGTAREGNP